MYSDWFVDCGPTVATSFGCESQNVGLFSHSLTPVGMRKAADGGALDLGLKIRKVTSHKTIVWRLLTDVQESAVRMQNGRGCPSGDRRRSCCGRSDRNTVVRRDILSTGPWRSR
jgi:hypothetical protein